MVITINSTVGLVVLIVIIIVSVLICLAVTPGTFEKSRANVFFLSLAALSIILIFLFYAALVQLNQKQVDLATIQETSTINNSIFDFSDSLRVSSKNNPRLVLSILPLMPCNSGDVEKCTDRVILSYQIFSVWSDILNASGFANFDQLAFTTAFLQRANSKELFDDWVYLKINFSQKVQQFGDILFTYGLPITEQTPEMYVHTARQLLKNPKYTQLLNSNS